MSEPLYLAPAPCTTCPYRRDVPAGIWAREEYLKLPGYDRQPFGGVESLATFHCHQEPEIGKPTVCRGWLSVHADSVAVRIARFQGLITKEDMATIPIHAEPNLYSTGADACRAGLKGVRRPGKKARSAIEKLKKRKAATEATP
jgi:hypothetical protein